MVDLALGHISALEFSRSQPGFSAINLGTGRGTSVLELVHAFEQVTGRRIPYSIVERRPGDVAQSWAGVERATRLLGWTTTRTIDAMCADGWRWRQANPTGYRSRAAA